MLIKTWFLTLPAPMRNIGSLEPPQDPTGPNNLILMKIQKNTSYKTWEIMKALHLKLCTITISWSSLILQTICFKKNSFRLISKAPRRERGILFWRGIAKRGRVACISKSQTAPKKGQEQTPASIWSVINSSSCSYMSIRWFLTGLSWKRYNARWNMLFWLNAQSFYTSSKRW